MSEFPKPSPEFDATLAKIPELARGRELFIALFKDKTPLVNLGYTRQQIEFSIPPLKLIEGEGEIITAHYERKPRLFFKNSDNKFESADIEHLPSDQGFYLSALREEVRSMTGWKDLPDMEKLLMHMVGWYIEVFPSGRVAEIALFNETAETASLDYLVNELYSSRTKGLKRENTLRKIGTALGHAATYRAAWVDEITKLELAVEIDTPWKKLKRFSEYHVWRRLNPISDDQGTVIPFGEKPNISDEEVKGILTVPQRSVVTGKLAWGVAGT